MSGAAARGEGGLLVLLFAKLKPLSLSYPFPDLQGRITAWDCRTEIRFVPPCTESVRQSEGCPRGRGRAGGTGSRLDGEGGGRRGGVAHMGHGTHSRRWYSGLFAVSASTAACRSASSICTPFAGISFRRPGNCVNRYRTRKKNTSQDFSGRSEEPHPGHDGVAAIFRARRDAIVPGVGFL